MSVCASTWAHGLMFSNAFLLNCESRQAAAIMFGRMISHTTISFSNMVGPGEQVEFCGHPVAFIAPSVYGPPEVSRS